MAVTSTIDSPAAAANTTPRARRRGTFGADKLWALAFATPYVAVFVAFVIYPIGYGLWLGSDPASYRALFGDPVYPRTVVNTLLYLLFGVNLKLLLALLAVGLFHAQGLVDEDPAADLHAALGGAGAAQLPVHQLDAERAMGADQQYHLAGGAGRRAALARHVRASRWPRSSMAISGNGCPSGP